MNAKAGKQTFVHYVQELSSHSDPALTDIYKANFDLAMPNTDKANAAYIGDSVQLPNNPLYFYYMKSNTIM